MSETVMHLVLEDGAREEDQEADLLNVLHLPRVVHLAHLPTHQPSESSSLLSLQVLAGP
jgi:hypothetical protein